MVTISLNSYDVKRLATNALEEIDKRKFSLWDTSLDEEIDHLKKLIYMCEGFDSTFNLDYYTISMLKEWNEL